MVTLTHPRTTRVQGWAACGRTHMEVAMKHFLTHIGTAMILATFAAGPLSLSAQAVEPCGLWSEEKRQGPESPRFRILTAFDGQAFLDMETCLVWRLDVDAQLLTLHDAINSCAHKGQGGPTGAMGWRLPSAAELTSLEGAQWRTQRDTFEQYQLPPMVRTETFFWTTTPWPPEPEAWAVVMFSGRTTISVPSRKDTKAGAWCVRCCPAVGLR
jgi:hypothetical protein